MTDYKALCAELYGIFEKYDDDSNLAGIYWDMETDKNDLLDRARAALAQPEPEGPDPVGPSDEDLDACADKFLDWNPEGIRAFARAVLDRWGNL